MDLWRLNPPGGRNHFVLALVSNPTCLSLVFISVVSSPDSVSVPVGAMVTATLLTLTPDEALRPGQVDLVPASVLQGSQCDCIHPDSGWVSQWSRHDGALQAPGLPVGGGPAWRNTLNKWSRVTDEALYECVTDED